MNEKEKKDESILEGLEKEAFKLASDKKWLFALDKLEEAIKVDKRWYHLFYKAIWLYNLGKQPEAAQVVIYGLNFEAGKEFYFRYLSADFLYRVAWTQAQNINEIDQSVTKMDQVIRELYNAENLLINNKRNIEVSRKDIPKELKDLYPTFLNSEDLTYEVMGLRTRIEMMRQTVVTFKAIIEAETRVNMAIKENRSRIESERTRTIELLGIFAAILAFIFSGVQIFTRVPLPEALILQGGMALIIIVFFLGIHLVIEPEARTKLLIGIFIILLLVLFGLPFYAKFLGR